MSSAPENWTQRLYRMSDGLDWSIALFLLSPVVLMVYAFFAVSLQWKTLLWSIFLYFFTGLGITAGYHRLFAHRAYEAAKPLQILLLAGGTAAAEGSLLTWVRDHRAHHRYTDSDYDPYDARKGFFYSHIGWLLWERDQKSLAHVDISDLSSNPLFIWQHKYYARIFLVLGIIIPTVIPGLFWNDWAGGFFFAAMTRIVLVQQATFCVNSLAHWFGETTFDDRHTPRDHIFTAVITLGEGYHNFHHEFPNDYRNAIGSFQYDPTKWLIWAMSRLGLAYNLKEFPLNDINKGKVLMQQKKLEVLRSTIDWGKPLSLLPTYTFKQFVHEVEQNGKEWIVIEDRIYDVDQWQHEHPGGRAIVRSFLGRDATHAFRGGVYDHSNAAANRLDCLRVGLIVPGPDLRQASNNNE